MRMKRLISVLLALCLLTSSLCSLAEGVPAAPGNPAGGAGTTANVVSESTENFLSVDVKYAETEWDGLLHATVAVSWPATNAQEAENVQLTIELFDGLEMQEGDTEISLGNILPGGTKLAQFTLRFDHSVEKPDYIPEPEMILTAWADGIGYTCYTARMDGTTEPKMMILGADVRGETPDAVINDVNMVNELFSGSYYNKYPFEITPSLNPKDGIAVLESMQAWETDDNDVTYLYINAHGVDRESEELDENGDPVIYPTPFFEINVPGQEFEYMGKKCRNMMSYDALLGYLEECVKGRIVLISEICYSGQFVDSAISMGLDSERFSIFTATNSTEGAPAWPQKFEEWDVLDLFDLASGMYTSDLCRLIKSGVSEDWEGVVRAGALAENLSTVIDSSMMALINSMRDLWKGEVPDFDKWLYIKNPLESLFAALLGRFWGNTETLIYCSNPEYDDGKRKLVVLEEKIEYMDPVELYYAYLREWVIPEIGLARRDDRFTGKDSWDWDEAYWAELLYMQGFSGLLSAAVCDLDKNGSLDMITLSIMPREQALIEATNVYYSINLEMYQIEKGVVVRSDLREDVLYIGEEANGIWSKMNCRLTEFEDQLIFRTHCYSTPGMSGIGDWAHYFDCTFMDGKIVDGAPSTYRDGHQVQTENGEIYRASNYNNDILEHMGDGIAAVEACFDTMEGAQYNATDATKLYEYIFGYEKPKAYKPLKVLSVPLQASRSDEVIASIRQSVADAMSAAGKKAYFHNISCNEDTEEFRQSIIYSDEWDYDVIDTENLRAVALAILTAPEVTAPEAVVSAMRDFEFAEVNQIEWEGSGWRLKFMMIPDGTYSLIIDCEE